MPARPHSSPGLSPSPPSCTISRRPRDTLPINAASPKPSARIRARACLRASFVSASGVPFGCSRAAPEALRPSRRTGVPSGAIAAGRSISPPFSARVERAAVECWAGRGGRCGPRQGPRAARSVRLLSARSLARRAHFKVKWDGRNKGRDSTRQARHRPAPTRQRRQRSQRVQSVVGERLVAWANSYSLCRGRGGAGRGGVGRGSATRPTPPRSAPPFGSGRDVACW